MYFPVLYATFAFSRSFKDVSGDFLNPEEKKEKGNFIFMESILEMIKLEVGFCLS